jgi:hypothetical protein
MLAQVFKEVAAYLGLEREARSLKSKPISKMSSKKPAFYR